MKVLNIIFILILSSFIVTAAQQTIISSSNDFRFDLLRYDPSPLEPGKSSDLYLQVTNLKNTPTPETEIVLAADFPLTIDNKIQKVSILQPGQSQTLTFHVSANKDTQEGSYKTGIQYSTTGGALNSEKLNIEVKKIKKSITTTYIIFNPEKLTPGKKGALTIIIKNTARSSIKDIKVKVDTSNSSTPFVTVGSTSERKIQLIEVNEEAQINFDLITLPSSAPGIYKVPLIISYIDEFGNEISNTEIMGVVIDAPIQYDLSITDRTVFIKDENGKITVTIANTGPSQIKFMSITLLSDQSYDIISKEKTYIGNIDSDDTQAVDFNIKIKNQGKLRLELKYKDVFNNEYTNLKDLDLKVYTNSKAIEYKFIKNNNLTSSLITIIFILLIITIIFEWIKNRSLRKGLKVIFIGIIVGIIKFFRAIKPSSINASLKKIKEKAKDND